MPSLSSRTTTVSITVTAVVCAVVATYEFRRRRRRRKRKSIECKNGSAFVVSSLKGELVVNNEESTASTTAATARSIGKGSRRDEKDRSRSVSRSASTSKENNVVASSLSTSSLSCKSRGGIRIGSEEELKDSQMMMNVVPKKQTKNSDDEEERDGRRILNQPDHKLVSELETKTSSSGGEAAKENQEEEEGDGGVDNAAVTKESVVEDNSTEEQHKLHGSDGWIRPSGVFNSKHKEKTSEVDSSEYTHGESHTAQEAESFSTSPRQNEDRDDYKVHHLRDRDDLEEKEQQQQQTKDNQELGMKNNADASSSSSSPFLQTRNSLRSFPSSPGYHTLHKRNKPNTLAITPTNNNKDDDQDFLPPPKDVGNYHILKSYWSNAASKNTPRGVLPLDDQRRFMNRSRSSSTRKFFVFSDKPIPKKNIKASSSSSSLQQDQSMEQDTHNNDDDSNDDDGKPMMKQGEGEDGGVDNDDDHPTTCLDMKKAERYEKEKAGDNTLQGEKKESEEEVGNQETTEQKKKKGQKEEEREETLNDNKKGGVEEKEQAAVVVTLKDEENEVVKQKGEEEEDAREEKMDQNSIGSSELTKAGDVDDDEMVEKQSGMNDKLDDVASAANKAASTESIVTMEDKEAPSKPLITPSGKNGGSEHLLSYNQEENTAPKPAGKEARAPDEDGLENLLETTTTDVVGELQVSDETETEKNQENCIGDEGNSKNIPAANKENEQVKETAHDAGEVVCTDDTKKEAETTEGAIHPDEPVACDSTISTAYEDEDPPGNMGNVPTNSDDAMRDFSSDTVDADMSTEKSTTKDESANISSQRQDQIHTMVKSDQTRESNLTSLRNVAEKEMSNESRDFGGDEIPHTDEDAHTKLDALTSEGGNVLQRVGSAKPLKERHLDSSLQTEKDNNVLQRVGSAKPLKERQRELEPSTQTKDKNVGGVKEGEVSDDPSKDGNAAETLGDPTTDSKQSSATGRKKQKKKKASKKR